MKIYFATLLVLFALMQLIQIDLPNKPVDLDPGSEIKAPTDIQALLRKSCYDCHSYEYKLPWYAYVAPVSWEVRRHIKNGEKWLNFQEWNRYDETKKQQIYKGIVKTIDFRMPLPSYLKMHPEARLSKSERDKIKAWAASHIQEEY